ncbi:MAG: hypothetical protein A2046_05075 [Bacteroidetes bacterium GWA2_30_7]|nr:MAG: hypothetical protein A2046_05075 [Bacteroidetes bacterium GWA2_30_7]
MIIKHFIKLNIGSKGYCLYIKNDKKFKEHDLNVYNEHVPCNYISIQKHIEKILFSYKLPVSISFNFDNSTTKLIVGFGLFLNIEDDKGREGIVYIHAVEINDINHLYSVILHFIKVLSPASIKEFYLKKLNDVAIGKSDVSSTLESLCNKLEEYKFVQRNETDIANKELTFSKIIHDCSGGSTMAWWFFADLLNNNSTNWEVFDDIESNGKLSTQLFPSINNESIDASDLFNIGIGNRLIASTTEPISNSMKEEPINKEIYDGMETTDISEKATTDNETEVQKKTPEIKKIIPFNLKYYFILLLSIICLILLIINSLFINSLISDVAQLQDLTKNGKHQIELLYSDIKNNKNEKSNENGSQLSNENEKRLSKLYNYIKNENAQNFINRLLTSIKGSGNKLTKDELNAAILHIDTFDIKTINIIKNLIDNFTIYDSDSSSKLDSKEIINLIEFDDL